MTKQSPAIQLIVLFFAIITVRLVFWAFSGADSFGLNNDARRYVMLADKVLKGDFNFNIGLFIVAPAYPVFIGACKLVSSNHWVIMVGWIQILLSGIAGLFLFQLAFVLTQKRSVATITTLIYAVYPTMYHWVFTIGQESLFQSFLIIAVALLIMGLHGKRPGLLAISAVIFSLSFLTKSHILMFAPFIPLIFLFYPVMGITRLRRLFWAGLYALICFCFTLPFGLYNLKHNETYTLSSSGMSMFFYYANTDYQYQFIVKTPPLGSPEFNRLYSMDIGSANGSSYTDMMQLPSFKQREKQAIKLALEWMKTNKQKYVKLKLANAGLFLLPALSPKHHTAKKWFLSLALLGPLYLMAYFGIWLSFKADWRRHLFIGAIFLVMFLFSVNFGHQGRFRAVTLDHFYALYAAIGIVHFWKLSFRRQQTPNGDFHA